MEGFVLAENCEVITDPDGIPIDCTQSKCLSCGWIGGIIDLEVQDEEISQDAMYFSCPECSSKDVKFYKDEKIYDVE